MPNLEERCRLKGAAGAEARLAAALAQVAVDAGLDSAKADEMATEAAEYDMDHVPAYEIPTEMEKQVWRWYYQRRRAERRLPSDGHGVGR